MARPQFSMRNCSFLVSETDATGSKIHNVISKAMISHGATPDDPPLIRSREKAWERVRGEFMMRRPEIDEDSLSLIGVLACYTRGLHEGRIFWCDAYETPEREGE